MIKTYFVLVILLLLSFSCLSACSAPSNIKMETPKYPDPLGYDLWYHWQGPLTIMADDWKCNETGNVTDIHLWVSFYADVVGEIPSINVSIASDGPGFPDVFLWAREFNDTEFNVVGPFDGAEGWVSAGDYWEYNNHFTYYRIDIENITAPFMQLNNTIYWLCVNMPWIAPAYIGWKTTFNVTLSPALYGPVDGWFILNFIEHLDPFDLAFVITGEPKNPPAAPGNRIRILAPDDNEAGICPCCLIFGVNVTNSLGEPMNLTFINSITGIFQTINNVYNGSYYFSCCDFNLFNTLYDWHVVVESTSIITISPTYHFMTSDDVNCSNLNIISLAYPANVNISIDPSQLGSVLLLIISLVLAFFGFTFEKSSAGFCLTFAGFTLIGFSILAWGYISITAAVICLFGLYLILIGRLKVMTAVKKKKTGS